MLQVDLGSSIEAKADENNDRGVDIEAEIKEEIQAMKKLQTKHLFQPINIDLKCGKCTKLIYVY